ncbi:hypothetical protein C8J56DRAFT_163389 [Mycena floridula]|nr:hypothetical protein C8J56DRAFT_163389 [Mycena floridula]
MRLCFVRPSLSISLFLFPLFSLSLFLSFLLSLLFVQSLTNDPVWLHPSKRIRVPLYSMKRSSHRRAIVSRFCFASPNSLCVSQLTNRNRHPDHQIWNCIPRADVFR